MYRFHFREPLWPDTPFWHRALHYKWWFSVTTLIFKLTVKMAYWANLNRRLETSILYSLIVRTSPAKWYFSEWIWKNLPPSVDSDEAWNKKCWELTDFCLFWASLFSRPPQQRKKGRKWNECLYLERPSKGWNLLYSFLPPSSSSIATSPLSSLLSVCAPLLLSLPVSPASDVRFWHFWVYFYVGSWMPGLPAG